MSRERTPGSVMRQHWAEKIAFRHGGPPHFRLLWGLGPGPSYDRPDGADESCKAFDSGVATRQRGSGPFSRPELFGFDPSNAYEAFIIGCERASFDEGESS